MTMKTCSVPECDKPVRARGWCGLHYMRWHTHGDVNGFAPRPTTEQRFWAKVYQTDDCWLWTGALTRKGYGSFRADGRTVSAHTYAYSTCAGVVPDGMVIDHTCHDPRDCDLDDRCPHRRCVNPDHMRVVTASENSAASRRSSRNRVKATCAHGHPFDDDNTYYDTKSGKRSCRACRRVWVARYDAKRRRAAA